MNIQERVARVLCLYEDGLPCPDSSPRDGCDPYCSYLQMAALPRARLVLAELAKWLRDDSAMHFIVASRSGLGCGPAQIRMVCEKVADELDPPAKEAH